MSKRKKVTFEGLMTGERVSRAKLRISTRKSGKKKSGVYKVGGDGGNVCHITMRSKGSSKISGAAMVPTMALPMAALAPLLCVRYRMTKKVTMAAVRVTEVIGLVDVKLIPCCASARPQTVMAVRKVRIAKTKLLMSSAPRNFPGRIPGFPCRKRTPTYIKTTAARSNTPARIEELLYSYP